MRTANLVVTTYTCRVPVNPIYLLVLSTLNFPRDATFFFFFLSCSSLISGGIGERHSPETKTALDVYRYSSA